MFNARSYIRRLDKQRSVFQRRWEFYSSHECSAMYSRGVTYSSSDLWQSLLLLLLPLLKLLLLLYTAAATVTAAAVGATADATADAAA